jgi:hypothetical protein
MNDLSIKRLSSGSHRLDRFSYPGQHILSRLGRLFDTIYCQIILEAATLIMPNSPVRLVFHKWKTILSLSGCWLSIAVPADS